MKPDPTRAVSPAPLIRRGTVAVLLAAACLLPPAVAEARVKLITLPVRERVEVRLDHPGATLVEEERVVPLVAGVNEVDFSWANTDIDPGSIVFRVLGSVGEAPVDARVLSVRYPPGEDALVWAVHADRAGSARVRISYLLGGLTKSFHYRAVADAAEEHLTLSQYLRVHNFAAESYDDTTLYAGYGERLGKPIGSNQTREVLIAEHDSVPVVKTYTVDVSRYGYLDAPQKKLKTAMHYVIHNDADHGLGAEPLPAGKARIFQRDPSGTTAFLGEDMGDYTPPGRDMQLYLGLAKDVVVTRTIERRDREPLAGNLSDYDVVVKYEIENFKDQPVKVRVVEAIERLRQEVGARSDQPAAWTLGPKTDFPAGPDPDDSSQHRVVMLGEAAPGGGDGGEKTVYRLHLRFEHQW